MISLAELKVLVLPRLAPSQHGRRIASGTQGPLPLRSRLSSLCLDYQLFVCSFGTPLARLCFRKRLCSARTPCRGRRSPQKMPRTCLTHGVNAYSRVCVCVCVCVCVPESESASANADCICMTRLERNLRDGYRQVAPLLRRSPPRCHCTHTRAHTHTHTHTCAHTHTHTHSQSLKKACGEASSHIYAYPYIYLSIILYIYLSICQ